MADHLGCRVAHLHRDIIRAVIGMSGTFASSARKFRASSPGAPFAVHQWGAAVLIGVAAG